jgi:hypothetical protein
MTRWIPLFSEKSDRLRGTSLVLFTHQFNVAKTLEGFGIILGKSCIKGGEATVLANLHDLPSSTQTQGNGLNKLLFIFVK